MSMQEQDERPSMTEVVESLNGFDEIAIQQTFGMVIPDLLTKNPTMAGRALLFVLHRRDGMKDPEARKAVMNMRLGDVEEAFRDTDEDDGDEAEPVTATGKDDERPD